VLGLSWHPEEPSLLLSLHYPSTIIQWDTATGNKVPHSTTTTHDTHTHTQALTRGVRAQLWSRELPEKLLAVEFDRFNPEELWAASAEGNMYLINGTVALLETLLSPVLTGFNAHHRDMGHYV
jgi:hypothetical protein